MAAVTQRVDGGDPASGQPTRDRTRTGIADAGERGFRAIEPEAASKRCYPAMQQALSSLESVEAQRPGSTQSLRPRIGAEERLPEFIEEAMRSGQIADGMMDILSLMPKATIHYITNRFGHCGFREDCDLLTTIIRNLGEDATQRLLETLQTAFRHRVRRSHRTGEPAFPGKCGEDSAGAALAMAALLA